MAALDVPMGRRAVLLNGIGVILLASILFGVMAVCVRLASGFMPASEIAFARFAGSLCILLVVTRGRGLRPRTDTLGRLLLRGALGAGAIVLYYHGIQKAGAGLATLLNCTYPVFTAFFATTLIGERFDARLGAALLLNLVGVLVALGPGAHVSPAVLSGGLSALAAAVLAGAAVATARVLRTQESALLITTYFMAVGTVLTVPALFQGIPSVSPEAMLLLAAVIVTSLGGQVLLHQGLGFAPATQGSLAAATSVVTAALLAAVLLGERFDHHSVVGACCMLVAVGLAVSRR